MALGILVAGNVYWLLLPFGLFFVGFYYPVMKAEEQELYQGYGQQFIDYARRVPLFVPRLVPAVSNASRFSWARVVKNREHRTFLGLLITQCFLVARLVFF